MDIMVFDTQFKASSIIESFESLIWTDRYSKYGDFELYFPANIDTLSRLQTGYYLQMPLSDRLMIIENAKLDTDVELGNHLTITGRSLDSILDRRIIWPQTTLNGYLDDQIKKLFNENIINPSNTKRKIQNFIYKETEDEYIQSIKIQTQFTGDTLYDAVKTLCDSFSIGFKLTLDSDYNFVFQLYNGTDRSYDQNVNPYVVFSPKFENLINSSYYKSTEQVKNITYVAGEGEGLDRKYIVYGDEELSGIDRRELYTDARDISSSDNNGTLTNSKYNELLSQRGKEKLNDCKKVETFDSQVDTTRLYKYNKDFFMGDITEFENEYGMTSKTRIRY